MNYLVPWSGGVDSTGLIIKLLEEGHKVDALCWDMNFNFNSKQDTRQREAICSIKKLLEVKFKGLFNIIELNGRSIFCHTIDNAGFILPQLPIMMTAILQGIQVQHDRVAIGYIVGDDAISFLDDIQAIFNSWKPFMSNNPTVQLEFPFKKVGKLQIYNSLDDVIKSLVTWCESEDDVKNPGCGECPSCIKMKLSLPDLFSVHSLHPLANYTSPENNSTMTRESCLIKKEDKKSRNRLKKK